MPRGRKTQSTEAAAGQAYGERTAQEQAMDQMPLPQGAPTAGGGGPAPAAPAVDPAAMAQEAALSMPPPEAPPWAVGPVDENIHAGLSTGPGPGPEVLGIGRPKKIPVADMLLAMARATGDSRYSEMAQRAEYNG